MNEINNKFLLARDKFMTEMHLRQPRFIHEVCGSFTKKNKERMQKLKETRDSRNTWQNLLDRACFQHQGGIWNSRVRKPS